MTSQGNFFQKNKGKPGNKQEPKPRVCDGCQQSAEKFHTVKVRRTERMEGAASYGMVTFYYCESCLAKKKQSEKTPGLPSGKQLKNLLKSAKKGLR